MKAYSFTVKVPPAIEQQLKAEQAKRVIRGLKRPTIPALAAELVEKALSLLE
jgi:hypothetical protein